jgi:hypothetical protein
MDDYDNGVAYCVEDDCREAADIGRLIGFTDNDEEVVELVCGFHASESEITAYAFGQGDRL